MSTTVATLRLQLWGHGFHRQDPQPIKRHGRIGTPTGHRGIARGHLRGCLTELEEQKKKLSAFKEARRYRFVPDLVGGKTQYEENLA